MILGGRETEPIFTNGARDWQKPNANYAVRVVEIFSYDTGHHVTFDVDLALNVAIARGASANDLRLSGPQRRHLFPGKRQYWYRVAGHGFSGRSFGFK